MAAAAARDVEAARTILIVEDEHQICELLSEILEGAGFDSHCVNSDKGAYSVLSAVRRYAAILVDVNLGEGTTGFDVARFARQMDAALPVVYVSGHASEASFKAFGVPHSAFVTKPFTADQLLTAVAGLVEAAGR